LTLSSRPRKEHGDKILQVQESILKKVGGGKQTIYHVPEGGPGESLTSLTCFSRKRMETEKLLNDLEQRKTEMAHELDGMKQKALAFSLINQGCGREEAYRRARGRLQGVRPEGKDAFQDQLGKLRTLIGEKE